MKRPETAAYLAKARQSLNEAAIVAANGLVEAAGRAAYHAAYHAAQAYIFEISGRAAKTHNGVRSEFARLAREEPRIERSLSTFLARAYSLKEAADYAIGHDPHLTLAEVEQAIETARNFVDSISDLLGA
ncbi:HEPN domain-containing protein [Methylobacterium sp. JK268]